MDSPGMGNYVALADQENTDNVSHVCVLSFKVSAILHVSHPASLPVDLAFEHSYVNPNYYQPPPPLDLKRNPNARSRFGLASHYMSFASCISSFFLGTAGFLWHDGPNYLGSSQEKKLFLWTGIYCFFSAIIVFIWEYIWGVSRKRSETAPFRGIFYFVIGIFPCGSRVTGLVGAQWFITAIFEILAWRKHEEYISNDKVQKKLSLMHEGITEMNEIMVIGRGSKYCTSTHYITCFKERYYDLRQTSEVKNLY